jgi:hypothetical protein
VLKPTPQEVHIFLWHLLSSDLLGLIRYLTQFKLHALSIVNIKEQHLIDNIPLVLDSFPFLLQDALPSEGKVPPAPPQIDPKKGQASNIITLNFYQYGGRRGRMLVRNSAITFSATNCLRLTAAHSWSKRRKMRYKMTRK